MGLAVRGRGRGRVRCRVVLAVDDVQLHLARRAACLDATTHLARLGPDDLVKVEPQPVVGA